MKNYEKADFNKVGRNSKRNKPSLFYAKGMRKINNKNSEILQFSRWDVYFPYNGKQIMSSRVFSACVYS